MKTKFIIIGTSRSGSTLLSSCLNQNAEVICGDELLHPYEENRIINYLKIFKDDNYCKNINNISEWINEFYERDNCKAIGFKQVYEFIQLNDQFEAISKIKDLKIIHLLRNPLESYISFQQAKTSQKWHIKSENEREENHKCYADISEAGVWIDNILEWREKIKALPNPQIIINYENLVKNLQKEIDKIFDFLNVSRIKINPEYSKIRLERMEDRLDNWDFFIGCLPEKYKKYAKDKSFNIHIK